MPAYAQLFNRPDTHPVVLDVALFKVFGTEWIEWDPDSVFIAVEKSQNTAPSRQAKSRIYALSVLHSNNAYWEDWRSFEAMSWSLAGKHVDLAQLTPLHPAPMLYGYRVAKWIDAEGKLVDDVEAYAISVFLNGQLSLIPPDMAFLQDRLFATRPELRERAEMVKSLLLSGSSEADADAVSEDPVKVEASRHHVINALLNIVCSPPLIVAQAQRYGLENIVSQVVKGKA